LGALLVFVAPVRSLVPDERILYADVKGRVVDDATGNPAPGIPVSLLYETIVTDAKGEFIFQKVPMLHTAEISLRVSTNEGTIIGCTTFDVPVKFYPLAASDGQRVDVKIIEPGIDANVELRLKAIGIETVGSYCGECHIGNPCVETQTFQHVVESGKDLRGIIVKESELEKFREQLMKLGLSKDTYRKIRYQDTHPDSLDMNQEVTNIGRKAGLFQQPQSLALHVVNENNVEHRYTVCDTCHTRHLPTAQRQFVLMPFDEQSELCYQCHK
jgi:predicted CXXCH cytochrome family protein